MSDIHEYIAEHDKIGILFSADFEKAFYSIEHPFIFAVLELFGFGPQFIKKLETSLKNEKVVR